MPLQLKTHPSLFGFIIEVGAWIIYVVASLKLKHLKVLYFALTTKNPHPSLFGMELHHSKIVQNCNNNRPRLSEIRSRSVRFLFSKLRWRPDHCRYSARQKQGKTNMCASKLTHICYSLFLLNRRQSGDYLSLRTKRTVSFYCQDPSWIIAWASNNV